ncbi:MAG: hypothetical protein IKZ36_02670 [Kiritimatiellae bacterium]|nr:hypothetical protein [Kiritimatiellia bacterium]
MMTALQIARVVAVIALLCFASALAAPPNRLPLALRGLRRILRKDMGVVGDVEEEKKASPMRRAIAFLLVLVAVALTLI